MLLVLLPEAFTLGAGLSHRILSVHFLLDPHVHRPGCQPG